MNMNDWKSLAKGALKYFGPAILLFLIALQAGTPLKDAAYILYTGVLQQLISFLSKFLAEK